MINLIVADDHVVVRQALCEMLRGKGSYAVMAEASDGQELLDLLRSHQPDVIILDMNMPKLDGMATLEKLHSITNCPPVLVLSANEGERNVRAALKAGARGYILKNAAIDELEFAINSLVDGKTYLSPAVVAPLMSNGNTENPLESPLTVLTKREIEILTHLADGKPNREIAKMLHISTRTVDTHRSNILKKLKVKTNAELVKIAITNGLITV
ncbi:MAG: response regulator transcription factor [Oligoflexia bacterium]|nr:response regulator transcription factor [Oligoflexia bacterium]